MSMPTSKTEPKTAIVEKLQAENEQLSLQLREAEETLGAIRSGAVDALVVEQHGNHRIYTLETADRPYRLFVEEMHQGAATLQVDGSIAWCGCRGSCRRIPGRSAQGPGAGDARRTRRHATLAAPSRR